MTRTAAVAEHNRSVWRLFLIFVVAALAFGHFAPLRAASIPAQVNVNFESLGFGNGTDHGAQVFTSGDFTFTASAQNWIEANSSSNVCQSNSSCLYLTQLFGAETVTIQTTSGNTFKFTSFYDGNFNGAPIAKIEGYLDNVLVATQTTGFPSGTGATVTLSTAFQSVNKVVITSPSFGFEDAFDTFVFDPAPASQTITFANPGAQNFGTTPTLTATASSGLTVAFTSATTGVCTITSGGALTFVTTGTCTINANQAGNSTYNAATQVSRSFTVNAVVPGAPTIGTATAGDTQASVTFTAPASNGGATITGYTVTASPGGATGTGATSPITVTGLSNGTPYTFTVTATNSAGTGSASAASNSVTPKANQTITFANPGAQNFGTAPTLSATSTSSLTPQFTSSTTGVCTITSGGALTFVTAGTCTINANQAGNSSYNAAPQVSQSFTVNAVVPGAPTIGTATAGDTQASVAFTAPASNGGASITGYTVTSSPGGLTGTGASSPITVTGLTNGTAYTFTVTATNSAGAGSASSASNSITPKGSQTITFANPGAQNFGTTPTLTATATSSLTPTFTSSTTGVCTITSGGALTFVTAGTCTINADQAGNGSFLAAPQVSRSFTVNAVVPGAPTIGTATAGDTQASVAFTAPASNGGATITGYTVTSNPGGITGTGASSPITVTGLTNGVAYTFTVTATNSAGTGSASAASNSITPKASQTITFANPGAQNFGTTPTLTATASSSLTPTFTSSTTGVCTVTSGGALTFVSTGTCTINADQAGNGSYLAAPQVSRSFTVNGVMPSAPTIGTATAGNAQASVTFSAPASSGGSAITGYTVTSSPGGLTGTGAASPITVTGLSNGTAYTFTVTATNSAGTGPASSASNSVTPAGVPGAPTIGTATAGNGQASVTFTAPASNGGAAITGYTVTSSPGGFTGTGAASPITVTGLSNGTAYTFTVTATNSAGAGTASAASNSVTPAGVPGAPTIGTATMGNGQASVAFTAPASSGGSTITGYTVTSSPGGLTGTGTASPITVTGLSNGTAYTFTVTATNAVGTGTASAASNAVTPSSVPGAPTIGTATGSSGQASVTFTAPASNGGSAITSYTVTSSPGGLTGTGAASPIAVSGLANGTAYTFTVAATNAAGTGAVSAASNAVTPAGVPGAPTAVTATGGSGQVTINFTAPASNGGSAITSYTATSSPGGLTGSCNGPAACVITVSGLTAGTAYTFTVTATSSAGTGSPSAASNSITLTTQATASPATMQVQLNTAGTLDLAAFISGPGITGVSVVANPAHGATQVSGTQVTYTPVNNYFGTDTFSYVAVNGFGHSTPAVVTVTIVGRPDPTKDANVTGLLNAQSQTARNFSRAQIFNYQQRLESRHRATRPRSDTADGTTSFDAKRSVADNKPWNEPRAPNVAGDATPNAASLAVVQPSLGAPGLKRSRLDSARARGIGATATDPAQVAQNDSGIGGLLSDVMGTLSSIVSSSGININLAALSGNTSTAGEPNGDIEVWAGGNVRIGTRKQNGGGGDIDFTTDGISVGMDGRVTDRLTLGLGIGYARDDSTVGSDGTGSTSDGKSIAAYGSYQIDSVFIDGVIGYGELNMDTTRYVASVNDIARANRSGGQWFASLAIGYDYRRTNALLSPYARYDYAVDRLDEATETGAGANALNYSGQTSKSQQISLGLRGEYQHELSRGGWLLPRGRVEYQHGIEGGNDASIAYADC